MSEIIYRERPLQLVDINEEGIFEVTSDGINFLSSLKNQKIAVLCVTGPYRSGKSFLANLIMNNMDGFKVGATINACTKGLWVWGKPIELENGTKLLVIDCEGLGSVEKDRTNNIDMKIFTLSVLLSSCLIYNTKYAISEDKIEELSNAANLSKRINISKDKNNNLDFGDFFPDLIWVLRDFSLDRGNLTPKEYLEECLKNVSSDEVEGAETKNISREIITKNFRKRDCFTLIRPADEDKLKNLENEPVSSLKPNFIKQVKLMIKNIKETISPKKINNIELDGEALFGLLQTYVENINNEETPVILSALENVLLSKAKNISENNFEKFKNNINSKLEGKLPMNPNNIYDLFFEGQNNLINNFCKDINDTITSDQIGIYILKLFGRMKDELEILFENNMTSFEEEIEKFRNDLSNEIIIKPYDKLEESKIYFLNLSNTITNALNKYNDLDICDEFSKKLIQNILTLLQNCLFDNLRKIGGNIEDICYNNNSKYQSTIDDLNIQNKSISDALKQEKELNELKEKEIQETKIKLYELETKTDSMKRKNKEKEKEYLNNLNTEIQKYSKMENSYMSLIQEKDDKINILEEQMNKLNSKSSVNAQELTKENIKLKYELKKLKEDNNSNLNNKLKSNSNINNDFQDYNTLGLTNLFKNFQENVKTFKDNLNSLTQERENLYKKTLMEKFQEEMKWKTKNLGEEIINSVNQKMENITENYEKEINYYKKEINDLKNKIKNLEENSKENQNYKIKYDQIKNQFQDLMDISKNKDNIMETQKKTIKNKDDQINELTLQKDNFQIHLSEYINKYNEKNVEIDEIFNVVESILAKKKKNYENHLNNLSSELQSKFIEFSKQYKMKLS